MRIRIDKPHTLDELSLTLQKILAYLDDQGVASAGRINLYLSPHQASGKEKTVEPVKMDAFEIIADAPPAKGAGGRPRGNTGRRS